jgi:hypothetical protein
MLLLKTRYEHIAGVVGDVKHATDQLPRAEPGDIVLIHITKQTLPKGQKSIQYSARFRGVYRDLTGESQERWKTKRWKYIIELEDMREITPFNLEELQASLYPYGRVRTHCRLLPEDEAAVLAHFGGATKVQKAADTPSQYGT